MSYSALQTLGQERLDAYAEIGLGANLWSIQRRIAKALSVPRARVAVPSCNASGKTYLSAALALAFYSCFEDAKVITTSSKFDQLKLALWGEIRKHHANASVPISGRLLPGALSLSDGPQHFVVGHAPNSREGFQGIHGPHKLIVADEATSVDEETASGINALLSSGDSRLLLPFNPTSDDTWAAEMVNSGGFTVIKIRAWDTPNLACLSNTEIERRWGRRLEDDRVPIFEEAPDGANLITPQWLDELVAQGMGPGTVEWENRVEANFWHASETQLILPVWYEKARTTPYRPGRKVMGIDLAPYGDAENVIAFRRGNTLEALDIKPAMRPDLFWKYVGDKVREYKPDLVIYDADGVGAGSIGDAERAVGEHRLIPFRGAASVGTTHRNIRSLWWWRLRGHFENENIRIAQHDPKLKEQLTSLRYDFTDSGAIRIESKEKMRRRGVPSPDRADACFAAGTRVVTETGERPIEALEVGDRVLTRKGWRPVIATGSRMAAVVGRAGLVGTPEHPIWTEEQGWTQLALLPMNSTLMTATRLSIGAEGSSDTQTRGTDIFVPITGPLIDIAVWKLSIAKYGNTPTAAESLPDTISTTATGTASTTVQTTLSACDRATTHVSRSKNGLSFTSAARPVARNTRVKTPRPAFVPSAAGNDIVGSRARMPSRASVPTAGTTSSLTIAGQKQGAVRESVALVRVYNIQVAEQPEYFANGVLVHNCMYAFSIDPPEPRRRPPHPHSEEAMWDRDLRELDKIQRNRKRNASDPYNPLIGTRSWS